VKVLFHYDAGPLLKEKLSHLKKVGIDVVCCPEGPDEPFFTELKETDVLWHVLHPVTEAVLEQAPKLKLIQKIGVGVNTIDLDAAQKRGIAVCNMPGTNSRAVMEMTLLLILAASRRYPMMDKACRSGQWSVDIATRETFSELYGKCVGLVGFGAIAKMLAPILELLGAKVVYTATQAKPEVNYEYLKLSDLLQQADVVSLDLPLIPKTEAIIGKAEIALMKPGAIFINTARGGLVDESALVEALRSGHIGAAGLDVFAVEPASQANPLFQMDNVVVAPHVAWVTNETMDRSISVAQQNSLAVMSGAALIHQII